MSVLKRRDASTWKTVGTPTHGQSRATLAYAQATADQMNIGTTYTDLTGLSVTVTVPAGRRIRITGFVPTFWGSTASSTLYLALFEGATQLSLGNTSIASTEAVQMQVQAVLTPSAGTHTYRLQARASTGAFNTGANAAYPAFILVEDISDASLPYNPASVPVGVLAQAGSTTSINNISTNVDILSVNISVPAGRLLKITAGANVVINTAAGRALGNIKVDGVAIGRWIDRTLSGAGYYMSASDSVLVSPSAGSHVITMDIGGVGGSTLNLEAASTEPIHLYVEDVTPTPSPGSGAAGSTLAYAESTVIQGAISTTLTAITGLSATVTVPAGRRIRISHEGLVRGDVGSVAEVDIFQDGVSIRASKTYIGVAAGTNQETTKTDVIITPTAGTHTYSIRVARQSGTGTVDFVATTATPAYILVEDITGSVWPEGEAVTAGMVASEQWLDFVPTLVQGAGTVTKTVNYARYIKIGRLVTVQVSLAVTGTGPGANDINIGIPVPCVTAAIGIPVGTGLIYNASNFATYPGIAELSSSTTVRLRNTTASGIQILGTTQFAEALVSGDSVTYSATYEAAS